MGELFIGGGRGGGGGAKGYIAPTPLKLLRGASPSLSPAPPLSTPMPFILFHYVFFIKQQVLLNQSVCTALKTYFSRVSPESIPIPSLLVPKSKP